MVLRCAAACAAVAALGIAGCGGSGSSGSGGGSVSVKETEFAINPADASVSGGKVTIKVANDGKIVHALSIENAKGEHKDLETGPIQPGSTKTVSATIKPGTYEWYCPIPGHKAQGMKGKITVK